MIYLNTFDTHASYEAEVNRGGVDISLPNVSYCKDVKDVHYNPYNTVEFYVGEITGTTPETVKIYTDKTNHVDVQISEGNKWYTYVLTKDKGLFRIIGRTVKKVVAKANITTNEALIIPNSVVEASFKGSNTSNVTNMRGMFSTCRSLTSLNLSNFNTSNVTSMSSMFQSCNSITSLDLSSFNTSKVTDMSYMFTGCDSLKELDLSGWDTSKVTDMIDMFIDCASLKKITMKGCSQETINNILDVKPLSADITTE